MSAAHTHSNSNGIVTLESDGRTTHVVDISAYMLDGAVCHGLRLALSDVTGIPAANVSLEACVNATALEQLFAPRRYGDLREDVSLSFPFDTYEVTVNATGRVIMQED